MFNKEYYESKKQDLVDRSNKNVQKLVNSAFDFVSENADLAERMKELQIAEASSKGETEGTKEVEKPEDIPEKPKPKK